VRSKQANGRKLKGFGRVERSKSHTSTHNSQVFIAISSRLVYWQVHREQIIFHVFMCIFLKKLNKSVSLEDKKSFNKVF